MNLESILGCQPQEEKWHSPEFTATFAEIRSGKNFQKSVEMLDNLLSQAREEEREKIIKWVKSKKKYCTADELGYHDKNCDGCQIWTEDLIKFLT